ncbi:hypothetical protein Tco_0954414 [Tanacetum coccineum]|uniref:Uncharacterized protein n=1 Tax=Tanacetum coccineum TaxID=301880 RepID=A0ABQ5E4H0_9ASTR
MLVLKGVISGDRVEKEMNEDVERMSNVNGKCGDIGMECHNSNVSKSANADIASPVNDSFVDTLPTSVNEKGEEVVIFDEELVNEGNEKWKFTVCVDNEEVCFVKFKGEEEAWSIKGISTISSRLGRPIMMHQMTDDMCNRGTGRLGYARVLVEIEASKGFLDNIEINYVDKQNKKKYAKWVKVETEEEKEKSNNAGIKEKGKDGYAKVRNGRNFNGNGGKFNRAEGGFQGFRNGAKNNNVNFIFKPKVPIAPVDKGKQAMNGQQSGSDNVMESPSKVEKVWNIGKSNVEELKRSVNKYTVLSELDEENSSKTSDEIMINRRLIVDEFVKKKLQPSISDTKD